jgi:RNA polymerase sigma factor (sigma-70 family)
MVNNERNLEIEKAISEHQRLLLWTIHRADVPDDEVEDVLTEANLYVVEKFHRYRNERAGISTFLYWQCKGAIRRHYRREYRYKSHVDFEIYHDEDGEETNLLDIIVDPAQIDGRQIEEQIIQKEKVNKVILLAKENGIELNPFRKFRLSPDHHSTLARIWNEVGFSVTGD